MPDALGLISTNGLHDLQRTHDEQAIRDLQSSSSGHPKKIAQSARAFESLLIGKWLEAAEESLATVPGGDPDEQEQGALHQFSALGMQSLAESISAAGGLGIAKMLTQHLESPQVIDKQRDTVTLKDSSKKSQVTKVQGRSDR